MSGLPALREEIGLYPGPPGADGAPSWTLHDPARNAFFRIAWWTFEIIARWDIGDMTRIAERVRAETPLDVTPKDVESVGKFLYANFLLRPRGAMDRAFLVQAVDAKKTGALTWLLHRYLFFRVPLARPDRFLDRLAPLMGWAYSKAFLALTAAALLLGLTQVARQWEVFVATLVSTATLDGLLTFAVALVGVKVAHEFGHAITAKRMGCKVPTMGIAFLVMFPMLYTDVTEAWKRPDRRARLAVGGAGMATELAVAAWSTLAWALLPDGPARSAAFVLATVTWVSSLAINISPFMRFDGYYLAMDGFDLPNLHPRSFALARWRLRETLFALGEAPPEDLPRKTRDAVTAFGFATWIYRAVLFLGIALLVYHLFFKALGVTLFVVELGWFLALPVYKELKAWNERRARIVRSRRTWMWIGGLVVLFGLAAVPWRGQISAPAMLGAADHAWAFVPVPAKLTLVEVSEGDTVAAGDVLARLDSPDVAYQLAQAGRRVATLERRIAAAAVDAALREQLRVLEQELRRAIAERRGLMREMERLTVTAPIAGTVVDLDPTVAPGQWLPAKTRLMGIAGKGAARIEALVDERDVARLIDGGTCRFHPQAGARSPVACRIVEVEAFGTAEIVRPALAESAGGPIPARKTGDGRTVADGAFNRVWLEVDAPAQSDRPARELRGTAVLQAEPVSLLGRLWRSVAAVVLREGGA